MQIILLGLVLMSFWKAPWATLLTLTFAWLVVAFMLKDDPFLMRNRVPVAHAVAAPDPTSKYEWEDPVETVPKPRDDKPAYRIIEPPQRQPNPNPRRVY